MVFANPSILENNGNPDYKCAIKNEFCIPDYQNPCCHAHLECKLTFPGGFFKCIDKVRLGQPCNNDNECFFIRNAICSEELKKCDCKSNYVPEMGLICAPLLDESCKNNELCETKNSICINNRCQCKANYLKKSNNQCLRIVIGSYCENDTICETINYAKCSKDKVCTCTRNAVALDPTKCILIYDLVCWTTNDCPAENSICVDHKCQCKPNFVLESYVQCVPSYLGMTCKSDFDCTKFMLHTVCSKNKKCACEPLYYRVTNRMCSPITESLESNPLILKGISICVNDNCQCKPKFVYNGSACVPLILGEPCKSYEDCKAVEFADCSVNKVCVCGQSFVALNETTCRPLIGGFCLSNKDCLTDNSMCFDEFCQCKPNFTSLSDYDKCVPNKFEN
ncbi:prion-like-(Q/N-rich) domain-bearing protein 25 [Microplitis mediator]|uniref:prion-like-(Q/N-rich) domain-bearing protein 25 n=1 Tax=Microplitis mediator TaxID=375433 RepID=UPI00255291CC|nr:prion-like-(Q/N-rich) domain-bearing protein 25 [Microplitis mediator]